MLIVINVRDTIVPASAARAALVIARLSIALKPSAGTDARCIDHALKGMELRWRASDLNTTDSNTEIVREATVLIKVLADKPTLLSG
tara:strand:- start:18299 stop:18559 length:261 start_codon:yes stop_codon:yes gene_type:complete